MLHPKSKGSAEAVEVTSREAASTAAVAQMDESKQALKQAKLELSQIIQDSEAEEAELREELARLQLEDADLSQELRQVQQDSVQLACEEEVDDALQELREAKSELFQALRENETEEVEAMEEIGQLSDDLEQLQFEIEMEVEMAREAQELSCRSHAQGDEDGTLSGGAGDVGHPDATFGSARSYLEWRFGEENAQRMLAASEAKRDSERGQDGSKDGSSPTPVDQHADLTWMFGSSSAEKMLTVVDGGVSPRGEHRGGDAECDRPQKAFGSLAGGYLEWKFGKANAQKMLEVCEDERDGQLDKEAKTARRPGRVQEGKHADLAWMFGSDNAAKMLAVIDAGAIDDDEMDEDGRVRRRGSRRGRQGQRRRAEQDRWRARVSTVCETLENGRARKAEMVERWVGENAAIEGEVAMQQEVLRGVVEQLVRERERWDLLTDADLSMVRAKAEAVQKERVEQARRQVVAKVAQARVALECAREERETRRGHWEMAVEATSDEVDVLELRVHDVAEQIDTLKFRGSSAVRNAVNTFNALSVAAERGQVDIHHTRNSRTMSKPGSHCEPNGNVSNSVVALRKRVQSSAEKRRTGAHLADKSTYSLPQPMLLPQPSNMAKTQGSCEGGPLELHESQDRRRSGGDLQPSGDHPGVSEHV